MRALLRKKQDRSKLTVSSSILLCFIAIMVSLTGLTGCTEKPLQPVTQSRMMMGTVVDIQVYGKNAEKTIEQVYNKIQEIENRMSANLEHSEIAKINQMAGESAVKVSEDTVAVIQRGLEFAKLTDGAFDPTIGPLVSTWGISTNHPRVPTDLEIEYLTDLIDWKNVHINEEENEVLLTKSGMAIDLGAIAKGYAADEAAAILRANGIKSAYINLGGNVYVIGAKTDGSPWRIGIRDPFHPNENSFVGVISATDTSIVTSGTYERFFIKDGVKYHHILDPKTGYPAKSDLASVTIISPDSIMADAMSTSTFLLGKEAGKALIESLPNVEAVLVDQNRNVWVSDAIKEHFQIAEGFVLDETR